jgi:hypothetical protein
MCTIWQFLWCSFARWLARRFLFSVLLFVRSTWCHIVQVLFIVHGDLAGVSYHFRLLPTFLLKATFAGRSKACLCDFGLSNIVVKFLGPSYFTSTIGVRCVGPMPCCTESSPKKKLPWLGWVHIGKCNAGGTSGLIFPSLQNWIWIYPSDFIWPNSLILDIRTDAQVIVELHKFAGCGSYFKCVDRIAWKTASKYLWRYQIHFGWFFSVAFQCGLKVTIACLV